MRAVTRDGEIGLYQQAYQDPSYRMGERRKLAAKIVLSQLPKGTLLDVGTGRGETLALADAAGHTAQGTEVVESLLSDRVTYAEAHALPFKDGEFDHVTCWDVLEHLAPEDVEAALAELYRVARRSVTVSASELPDCAFVGGIDLHPSKRPAGEWLALMRKHWGNKARQIGKAGPSPMFQVIK